MFLYFPFPFFNKSCINKTRFVEYKRFKSIPLPHYFSFIQAQKALTLVQPIVADCQKLYKNTQKSLPLSSKQEQHIKSQAEHYIKELEQIGCVLQDPARGIVDFITVYEGREVALCWRLGEPTILHWHEISAGFKQRQAITPNFLHENIMSLYQTQKTTI